MTLSVIQISLNIFQIVNFIEQIYHAFHNFHYVQIDTYIDMRSTRHTEACSVIYRIPINKVHVAD